jgi:hypothetical protein
MEERKKTPAIHEPTHKVCLKCNNVVRTIHTSGNVCPRCGFRLVPPPEYSGWAPLDVALFKFSNTLLNLQKLTSIWTWMATEETRSDEVAQVLPPEQGNEGTSDVQKKARRIPVARSSPSLLWWILTSSVFAIVLYVVLTS